MAPPTSGEGTPNDNLTMFDFTGHALPSVQFLDPLRACREFVPTQAVCGVSDAAPL